MSRPLSVTVSRTVEAPVETVWAVSTDLEAAPRTMSGIDRVEILAGETFGVGTRWRETRTMMGREATEEMWITRAERPEGYTAEAESRGWHYVSTFTFTPLGADRTGVRLTFAGTPTRRPNVLVRVLGGLGVRMARKQLAKDLDDLAAAAEAAQLG